MSKKYLNLGCGGKFVPGWTNIDLVSSSPDVDEINFLNGLPYSDGSFEVIYSSQVLEHFDKPDGEMLLHECHRVLQLNGILRLVVPDLENITEHYLSCLQNVRKEQSEVNKLKYEWAMIELLDQLVRTKSGGLMKQYLEELTDPSLQTHVVNRCGQVVKSIMEPQQLDKKKITLTRVRNKMRSIIKGILQPCSYLSKNITHSGELHKWMYDSYSLSQLLIETGFRRVQIVSPNESRIANWEAYPLDVVNGVTIDPKSLFIECLK